ncbi:MAG: DUF1761 domain-containing protein [Gammaproteobacteria bacterium]|nr:DUF1761 domain-containing protein [Gammaproteobacteria bacterium]
MDYLVGLNWIAIIVVTVVAFLIGWVWYGPVFGKAWLSALGKTEDEIQPSPTPFIISFITSLLTCIVMAVLIQQLGINTWMGGAVLGLVVGIGFIAASSASDTAFCGWSWNLWLIQSGYRVVYSVVMGLVLAIW